MDRRTFLKSVAGLTATSMLPLDSYAQQHKGKVKITDVKCMIVRGTWDWNLIKIETDSGVYGIGEAYWGWGVKDLVLNKLRPIVVGEDPLNVDKLYTKMLMESAGAGAIAGVTVTAASGIEIALWDLAAASSRRLRATCWADGSAIGSVSTARCPLSSIQRIHRPGASRCGRPGRRSSAGPRSSSREMAFRQRPIPTTKSPGTIPIRADSRTRTYGASCRAMETVREELGPDVDFGVEAHWRYDVRDVIQHGREHGTGEADVAGGSGPAGEPRSDGAESRTRSTFRSAPAKTCTRAAGLPAADRDAGLRRRAHRYSEIRRPDGVEEAFRPGGQLLHLRPRPTIRRARSARSPRATPRPPCASSGSTSWRRYIDWWQDLVVHEGPIWKDGYFTIQDKPGYGIEINPDVAKAHLAPGETWWG